MSFSRKLITLAGQNRANGEEVAISGRSLLLNVDRGTPEVYIAFDSATSTRFRVRSGLVIPAGFASVWVFHDDLPDADGPLELIASSECYGAHGGQIALVSPTYAADADPETWVPQEQMRAVAATQFQALHDLDTAAGTNIITAATADEQYVILGYRFALTADAALAAAGNCDAYLFGKLFDSAFSTIVADQTRHRWYLPAASLTNAIGALDTGWTHLGPGGLWLARGESLKVYLSAALSAGSLSAWVHYSRVR